MKDGDIRLVDGAALEHQFMTTMRYLEKDQVMDAAYIVNKAPTIDAVPVVRCRDCKNWGGVVFGNVCRRWSAPLAGMRNDTGPDDFCSYGERKDGDGE